MFRYIIIIIYEVPTVFTTEYRWLSVLWALIFDNYFYSAKSRMKRSCFFSLKSSFEQESGL